MINRTFGGGVEDSCAAIVDGSAAEGPELSRQLEAGRELHDGEEGEAPKTAETELFFPLGGKRKDAAHDNEGREVPIHCKFEVYVQVPAPLDLPEVSFVVKQSCVLRFL